MKNKQIVSFVLAGMLTVSTLFGGITAQAAETNTMSETGTKACDIKATIGSEFTVTLPKTITLDSKTKAADYTISCEGDLAGAESVTVTPDVSFAMTQNDKADVTATVTQTKTTFRSSTYETALTDQEVKIGGETITGNITAPGLTAGTWDGTMNSIFSEIHHLGSRKEHLFLHMMSNFGILLIQHWEAETVGSLLFRRVGSSEYLVLIFRRREEKY